MKALGLIQPRHTEVIRGLNSLCRRATRRGDFIYESATAGFKGKLAVHSRMGIWLRAQRRSWGEFYKMVSSNSLFEFKLIQASYIINLLSHQLQLQLILFLK